MLHSVSTDRRHGRRYLVVGTAVITTASGQFGAELVNLGSGGMLVFCDTSLSVGERVKVLFQVNDYPLDVCLQGHVVHAAAGLVGIGFLEDPEELEEVLLWLEAGFLACLI